VGYNQRIIGNAQQIDEKAQHGEPQHIKRHAEAVGRYDHLMRHEPNPERAYQQGDDKPHGYLYQQGG